LPPRCGRSWGCVAVRTGYQPMPVTCCFGFTGSRLPFSLFDARTVQLKNSWSSIYVKQHAFTASSRSINTNWTLCNCECFIGVRSYRAGFRLILLTDRGRKAENKFCNSQLTTHDSSSKCPKRNVDTQTSTHRKARAG